MPTAPSTAELMRRIDDIVARLDKITESLERSYLRADVYQADRAADAFQLKALEDGQHLLVKRVDGWETRADRARSARWSLIASSLLGPVLVVIVLRAMGLVSG